MEKARLAHSPVRRYSFEEILFLKGDPLDCEIGELLHDDDWVRPMLMTPQEAQQLLYERTARLQRQNDDWRTFMILISLALSGCAVYKFAIWLLT